MLNYAAEDVRNSVIGYFAGRFGIPREFFENYALLDWGSNLRLVSRSPHLEAVEGLKIEVVGLRLARRTHKGWKPTSAALQFLAPQIRKNLILLEPAEAISFLRGEALQRPFDAEPGYVAVEGKSGVLGCGLYRPPLLLSQIPAASRAPFFAGGASE